MDATSDTASYEEARRKVQKLKGFYTNLGAYILVNVMLIAINLYTSPGRYWFYWVTIIWGIFLVWNAVNVFSGEKIMGKDWEEKKIQEYMKK